MDRAAKCGDGRSGAVQAPLSRRPDRRARRAAQWTAHASDRESLRRQEELELAQLARQRRMQAENVATERQALHLEQERFHAEMEAEQDRVKTEAPVRMLRITTESDILRDEVSRCSRRRREAASRSTNLRMLWRPTVRSPQVRARSPARRLRAPSPRCPYFRSASTFGTSVSSVVSMSNAIVVVP